MKYLFLALLFSTSQVWCQSSKSIEITEQNKGQQSGKEVEAQEEQLVRQEWDQEEAKAQAIEERNRLIDEERAENGENLQQNGL